MEVLVASVILVICMAGIMNSFAVGSYFKKNTEEITNAAFLGQELMNVALYLYTPSGDEEQPCHYPFNEYTYKFKMEKFNGSGTLNRITVQVMTPPSAKFRRRVELTALKTEKGY